VCVCVCVCLQTVMDGDGRLGRLRPKEQTRGWRNTDAHKHKGNNTEWDTHMKMTLTHTHTHTHSHVLKLLQFIRYFFL